MKRGIISCAGNERLPYKVQSADLKLVAGRKTA